MNSDIKERVKLKIAISKEREKEERVMKDSIYRKIAIVASIIFMFSGVAFAGQKIIEKIWREPEKVESFYGSEEKIITDEEKQKAISEEEAKERAIAILEEYGYGDEIIESIEFINNPVTDELLYKIVTQNNCEVEVDGLNKENYSFFSNILYQDVEKYHSSKDVVEAYVREFCQIHGINLTDYQALAVSKNGLTEEDSYLWHFHFYKKYGELVNTYEEVSIAVVPEINEIYYVIYQNLPFENSEIVITKEEAKQIVIDEEKKIPTGLNIKEVTIGLDITKMNGDAYIRTNHYEQYIEQTTTAGYPVENIVYYRTDHRVRKVYVVCVEYDTLDNDRFYSYFVDVTTGEIIGGTKGYHTTWYQIKNNVK